MQKGKDTEQQSTNLIAVQQIVFTGGMITIPHISQ